MNYRHSVIIGKFMPPHFGHCFLIDVALRASERVTLFICSLPDDRIDGVLRVAWLRNLFPTLNVIHIDTARPEAARGEPQSVKIWADTIRASLNHSPDAIFASEVYGAELATLLSAHFVIVDAARSSVPISGKSVLAAPLANLHYLPEVVREYFILPVILASATPSEERVWAGKLARRFATTALTNYHVNGDRETPAEFLVASLRAQMRIAHRLIFLCRTLLDRGLDKGDLLPQSYHTPLCITISHREKERSRIDVDTQGTRQRYSAVTDDELFLIAEKVVRREIAALASNSRSKKS